MEVVCLDLEGVLVPEIWISFAKHTGIAEFAATTRDIADYDVLMQQRLHLLHQHGFKLQDIQAVIAQMQPFDGARAFLDELRLHFQVIILSDTFYEFAQPLMQQLGYPSLFCHQLKVDPTGIIVDYQLRQADQKTQAVKALHDLNFRVLAAGDSYNDIGMLSEAEVGFLFEAPQHVIAQFPQFRAIYGFDALKQALIQASVRQITSVS